MELAIVVRLQDGPPTDLVVDLDRDDTAAELTAMALRALRISEDLRLFHVRADRWLDPSEPIGDAGVARADEFVLATPATMVRATPRDASPVAEPYEIAVVGGPLAGHRQPLGFGTHRVGRDPRSDVVIGDVNVAAAHFVLHIDQQNVRIEPHGGRVAVDGVPVTESRVLRPGTWIECGTSILAVRPASARPYERTADGGGRVPFNRPPRHQFLEAEKAVSLPAPPEEHKGRKIPLALMIIPLLMSGVLVYLPVWIGQSKEPQYSFLGFALLSPVMMVAQWFSDRRSGKRDSTEARRRYIEQARATGQRVRKLRRIETEERRVMAPDLAVLRMRAVDLDPTLWERRIADDDSLQFRVGTARRPSDVDVTIAEGGSDTLRSQVAERCAPPEVMPFVPVISSVHTHAAFGIAGTFEDTYGVASTLLVQAATLHSPRELAICVAVPESEAARWDWVKWLPHADPAAAPIAGELVAVGPDAAGDLLERILALVERRRVQRAQFGSEQHADLPVLLLFIDESVVRARPRAARLLENAAAHGVRVIWMAREARNLPGECGEYLEVHDVRSGTLHRPTIGTDPEDVVLDGFAPDLAREVGLALAPVVDHTTAQALGGGIPVVSRLTDLLGMPEPNGDAVVRRWAQRPRGLSAVVGEAADGPYHLDLRQDGPHGLIAGITGSGKSELLQSMVVSLAATHPPDRLNFLFVDYKGGTAFSSCTTLPHAVGMVTDLDGQLAQRVLISLNAELRRREHLLRDLEARDLIDLEMRHPADAPPSLVIIIDEFAALAREVPEFIDGVVDIAQRGRSLGLHLLLATQRPSGVVNENIRANTNLRIALRVADGQDSADVLGRDDAAHIPRTLPGRAFARTGHSDFTSFQSAWAGGLARGAATSTGRSVRSFALSGQAVLWCDDVAAANTGLVTELTLLCAAINDAAVRSGHDAPDAPWLEPLPSVVPLESLELPEIDPRDPASVITYGLADLPAQQSQVPLTLNLETGGNIVIFGASGAGKTTLMRTLAASAAACSAPTDIVMYGIDGGAGGLDPLRALPHCGAVAPVANTEMVTRILTLFEFAMGARREVLARVGASSLGDLRRRPLPDGAVPPPRMVLLIDNFGTFSTAFERVEYGKWIELVQQLAAEGRPLGIHIVISADRRSSVPFGLLGVMSDRVLLRAVDADELSGLGVPYKVAQSIKLGDGRALVGDVEVQCAVLGGDASSDGQIRALQEFGDALRARTPGVSAPPIQGLPDAFSIAQLAPGVDALHPLVAATDQAVGLRPVAFDLENGNVLVVGRKQTGRTSSLATIAQGMLQAADIEIHALCPRRNALSDVAGLASVTVGELAVADALSALADQAEAHQRATPFVVLLDDADVFSEHLAAADIERLLTGPGRHAVRLVIALDPATVSQAFMGWVPEVRRFPNVLLLKPDLESDGDAFGVRLAARPGQRFTSGRGFLVADREAVLIQMAQPTAPEPGSVPPGPFAANPGPAPESDGDADPSALFGSSDA